MAQSWPLIIALATKSGIPFTVSSTYRPGSRTDSGQLDYHSSGQAVDFGGYSQDALAQYFMQFSTLEVIHLSDATGTVYGSKNDVPYQPGSNQQLLQEHRNHLHVAMTTEQAQAALAGGDKNPHPTVGTAIKSLVSSLPNPFDPAATIVDQFRPFAVAVGALTKPQFWKRFGMYLIGLGLIGFGIGQFLKRPVGQALVDTKQAVGGVIATGVQGAAFSKGANLATGSKGAAILPGGQRTPIQASATVGSSGGSGIPAEPLAPPLKGPPKPPPAVAPVTAVLPPSKGGLTHNYTPKHSADFIARTKPRTPVRATATVTKPRPLPNPSRLSANEAIERMTNPKKRKKK